MKSLERELQEETNLSILTVQKYLGHFDYTSGSGKRARQFNFFVETSHHNVRLNPQEHSQFSWLPLSECLSHDNISDNVKNILRQIPLKR